MSEKDDAGVEEIAQEAPLETEVKEEAGASAAEEDKTDYKALYEKEAEKTENYKKALTQKRQLRNKPEVEETDEAEDELSSKVRKIIREEVTPALAQNKVDSALESIKDPEKRKLVKFYYENRIRQTGTDDVAIRNDIDNALAIADGQRLKVVNAELTRKTNMQKQPSLSGSASDRTVEKKNHKFSDDQVKVLTATALRIGADPTKFIEKTWQNQQAK